MICVCLLIICDVYLLFTSKSGFIGLPFQNERYCFYELKDWRQEVRKLIPWKIFKDNIILAQFSLKMILGARQSEICPWDFFSMIFISQAQDSRPYQNSLSPAWVDVFTVMVLNDKSNLNIL